MKVGLAMVLGLSVGKHSMASLPEGIASSQDCPGTTPVFKTKGAQHKSKSRHGCGALAGNDAISIPWSDPFGRPCDSNEQATGQTESAPVISTLQEFLQDSKTFRIPNQHSILQWDFEQCFVSSASNKFRATVSFLLEGVPHHVAGDWHNSKSGAKRDAAGRALGLFVSQWGSQLPQEGHVSQSDLSPDSRNLLQNLSSEGQADHPDVDTLINFCLRFPPCQQILPQVSAVGEGDSFKGFAEISLFGVPHTLAGVPCKDGGAARVDIARRTLWYLQCSGFSNQFEVDYETLVGGSGKIAPPPSEWTVDGDW